MIVGDGEGMDKWHDGVFAITFNRGKIILFFVFICLVVGLQVRLVFLKE